MHHGRTKTGRIAGVNGLLVLAAVALLPSPAKAQCREWYVGFEWSLQQGDLEVFVDLQQRGKVLSGRAYYRSRKSFDQGILRKDAIDLVPHNGIVAGTIEGNNITLDMEWNDGSGGLYTGVIGPTGVIRGTVNVDKTKPTNIWNWVSRKPMICGDKADKKPKPTPPAAVAQASPKRLISHKGKAATNAGAPAGVPKIVVFSKPGQASGTLTVTWDGGPDHPYAEVWVSVDGGEETKVVEQGKGMRQVTVEPGKTYLYILTDAGQRLATDTATGK